MLLHGLSLLLGIFALSTSVIMIKQITFDPLLLSAFRLLIAALVLSPWFIVAWRKYGAVFGVPGLRRALVPGIVLALHFATWVVGARATLAVNASLIVNMMPLATPFWLWLVADERVSRYELAGTAIGLVGLGVLTGGEVQAGAMAGNLICFGSMLLGALYIALGRRNRDAPSLFLYLVPLYAVAGVVCLLCGLPRLPTLRTLPASEYGYLLALALVPTVIGHSLINRAMTHFRGGVVSVCNLSQFVFAGVNGWVVFGELPRSAFWPAAALVVAGAGVALRATLTPRGAPALLS